MATNPSTLPENAGRITAPDGNYPYGSSKDDTTGTAGDGTPLRKAWANDNYGFQQALLRAGSLVPTGNSDTGTASQYLQGVVQQAQGRAILYNDTGAADAYVLGLRANQQAPGVLFDGQEIVMSAVNDNTAASTVDVSVMLGQSVGTTIKNIKESDGSDPIAGQISGRTRLRYDLANDWMERINEDAVPSFVIARLFGRVAITEYRSLITGNNWLPAFNQAVADMENTTTGGPRELYFPQDFDDPDTDANGNYIIGAKPDSMGVGIALVGDSPRQFIIRGYTASTITEEFLHWDGSAGGPDPNNRMGGGIRNLGVFVGNGFTSGTALTITGVDASNRPGYMYFENVVVTADTGTWAFGLRIKGENITDAGSQGMRDIIFNGLYLFRNTSEAAQITNAVHARFDNLLVNDGGAGNPSPIFRINGGGAANSNSTLVFLGNMEIGGTLALTDCSDVVAMGYADTVNGTITATNCRIYGRVNTQTGDLTGITIV